MSLPQDSSLITHVSHRAMATEFVIMLPAHQADAVASAVAALEHLDEIENALTIYQPESEISRVNALAAEQPVTVSPATFRLIERAILWSRRSDGAFDITAGPLVEVWGFTRRRGRKPDPDEVAEALSRVGYQYLTLDSQRRTVRFQRPGMSINLGGIGKGDALDRIANRLVEDGLSDFLLHGGSSSIVARGDQTAGSEMGWMVGISHPTKPKRRLGGIWLRDSALATSGSGKQFFHHRGRRYGHVIDPRTGYPSGELLSLTVVMSSAADADACSTALFVGQQTTLAESADWELPARIAVSAGPRQDETELESFGEIHWVQEESDPEDASFTSED